MYIVMYRDGSQTNWFARPRKENYQDGARVFSCTNTMPVVGLCEWARRHFPVPFVFQGEHIVATKWASKRGD